MIHAEDMDAAQDQLAPAQAEMPTSLEGLAATDEDTLIDMAEVIANRSRAEGICPDCLAAYSHAYAETSINAGLLLNPASACMAIAGALTTGMLIGAHLANSGKTTSDDGEDDAHADDTE